MSGGALDASVTLEEVFAVVGSKRVPLAPELAGYLALEIAERADPDGGGIEPKNVFVSEEGSVALVKPRRDAAVDGAESSVRSVLTRLIEASGSQTPALAAACKRRSGGGLPALVQELEAALIPVNRAAGRRALARLAREVKRVTLGVGRHTLPSSPDSSLRTGRAQSGPSADSLPPSSQRPRVAHFSREEDQTTRREQLPDELLVRDHLANQSELPTTEFKPRPEPSPSQADVDDLIADFAVSGGGEQQHARELKALAGLEPTPPPPTQLRRPEPPPAKSGVADAEIEALLALGHGPRIEDAPRPAPPGGFTRGSGAAERKMGIDLRQLPTQPAQHRLSREAPPTAPHSRTARGSWVVFLAALLAVATGAYAMRELQPGAFLGRATGRTGDGANRTDGTNKPGTALQPGPTTTACKGTLVVTDVPGRAEVLLLVGQAPVDVERMPVGARLEFVATAEGYAAKRVVVPAGARWDAGADGKPRFEAALQLDPSRARSGAMDPWPAGEPGSSVGGRGPAGTVHVVTSPRGAEVWMLAGIGPEARVEQLSCERDIDVLIAGPTTARRRLHVAGGDFVSEQAPDASLLGGEVIARISAR